MKIATQISFVFLAAVVFGLPAIAQQPGGTATPESVPQGGPPEPPRDVINESFYAPDFVLGHEADLGLQSSQVEAIKKLAATVEAQAPGLQDERKKEMEAFEAEIQNPSSSEQEILAKFDQVLKQERKLKQLQLIMLIRVREQLTPEQRSQLDTIKANLIAQQQQLQQRIRDKVIRIQQAAQRMAQAGQQPTAIAQALQQFQQKAQQGDVAGAEAILDQVLQQVEGTQP